MNVFRTSLVGRQSEIRWIAAIAMIVSLLLLDGRAVADESPVTLLERGVYLESVEDDPEQAIELYERVLAREDAGNRTRAEATLRAGESYDILGELLVAKLYYHKVVDEYPQWERFANIAREGLEVLPVEILEGYEDPLPKDFQYVGDLLISLEGALDNGDGAEAGDLLGALQAVLGSMRAACENFEDVKVVQAVLTALEEVRSRVAAGTLEGALEILESLTEARVFSERSFFSESDEVFSPVLVQLDSLAEAINSKKGGLGVRLAEEISTYLGPLDELSDSHAKERQYARDLSATVTQIQRQIASGTFGEARKAVIEIRKRSYRGGGTPRLHLGHFLADRLGDHTYFPDYAVLVDLLADAFKALIEEDASSLEQRLTEAHAVALSIQERSSGTFDQDLADEYVETVAELVRSFKSDGMNGVEPLLRRVDKRQRKRRATNQRLTPEQQ